ncbi:MAG: methyl-accepting chemotaxis protein, partial [Spirochaetales bacterium]|nr:methyl-accepting chemotaxis protein [Spirochaetales bacterium]
MKKSKMKVRNSLAFKINLYFLIFLSLIFTVLGFTIRYTTNSLVTRVQSRNLERLGDSITGLLSNHVENMGQLVYAHSINPEFIDSLKTGNFYQADSDLKKLKNQNDFFESAFLLDSEGMVLGTTDSRLRDQDYSSREFFSETIKSDKSYRVESVAVKAGVAEYPAIMVSAPVIENGRTLGVIVVTMDMDAFGRELVVHRKIGETGYPFVIDSSGQVFIHPDSAQIFANAWDWDFINEVRDSGEDLLTIPYTFEGVEKMGSFIWMEEPRWLVGAVIETREIFHIARQLTIIISVFLLIVGFLIALFLTTLVRRNVTGRLFPLESLMAGASEGKLTERGEVRGLDEVAAITGSYNTLIDSLGLFFGDLNSRMNDLDAGGSELAANMEETAAAVHQIRTNIGSSVKQIRTQDERVHETVTVVSRAAGSISILEESIEKQSKSVLDSSTAVEELIAQVGAITTSTGEAREC